MKNCIYCTHANTLYYTTPTEQTNFKYCDNWIYCKYFHEPKDITDYCKNFEEETQLPF